MSESSHKHLSTCIPAIAVDTLQVHYQTEHSQRLYVLIIFSLFPICGWESKVLLFLPKATNYNANVNLTDFKVIVLNPYIVPILPRGSATNSGKCFFSWFLLCFVCLSLHCELLILFPMLFLLYYSNRSTVKKWIRFYQFCQEEKFTDWDKSWGCTANPM